MSISVTYEIEPAWRFVSKQIAIVKAPSATYRVSEVHVFRDELAREHRRAGTCPRRSRDTLGTGDYGLFLRFADARGLLAAVQNPFLQTETSGGAFVVRYAPDMEWRSEYGPFIADRGMLAPYRQSGRVLPARMPAEWVMASADPLPSGMDEAEIAAFTDLVRAFLLYRPARPLNIMVGWCVNDYQIDVAGADGRAEYQRIIDRAAELGAQYLLYAPSNTSLSRREDSLDDWSWEHVALARARTEDPGGRVGRQDRRDPADRARDARLRESKNVKLVAYVYPVVPFAQNPAWLVSSKTNPARKYASLGVRSLQDWLIEALVTFHQRTGIGGYAFDHTFLGYEGTSRYAQWAGWRRVMEELRRRHPGHRDRRTAGVSPLRPVVVARRQLSAPHVQRRAAGELRARSPICTSIACPPTASATRPTDTGCTTSRRTRSCPASSPIRRRATTRPDACRSGRTEDRGTVLLPLRARDWDYLGWRYSLLSSIATGGWNNVLNMIPARDSEEGSRLLRGRPSHGSAGWIDWTQREQGLPAAHAPDPRAARDRPHRRHRLRSSTNRGFVFLFNPNGRRLSAGVHARRHHWLERPRRVRTEGAVAARRGGWSGSRTPASGRPVIGCRSRSMAVRRSSSRFSRVADDRPRALQRARDGHDGRSALAIADARGEVGSTTELFVQLPAGRAPASATVNGQPADDRISRPRRRRHRPRDIRRRDVPAVSTCRRGAGSASLVARSPASSRFRGASSTSWRRGARPGQSHGRPRTSAPRGWCRNGCCCSCRSPSPTRAGTRG